MESKRFVAAIICAVTFVIIVFSAGCCQGTSDYVLDKKTGQKVKLIKMGLVPSEDAEIVIEEGDKMAELLGEMTGLKFRAYVTPNYNILISAMRAGDVDFAWLPPLAYAKSKFDGTGTVLLKAVRGDNPFYYGAIIVRADSGYNNISDLKGKIIGWGDMLSFSGHIYPKYNLIQRESYTRDFFAKEVHMGSHPAVVKAVLNKSVAAGAVWANSTDGLSGAWLLQDRKEDREAIKAIFFTDPIPGDTFTVRTGFMEEFPELTERIRQAVIDMPEDEEGKRILKTVYRIDRMDPATHEDYRVVFEAFDAVIRK